MQHVNIIVCTLLLYVKVYNAHTGMVEQNFEFGGISDKN